MGLLRLLSAGARGIWNALRAVMGDTAYERHLEAAARLGTTPLSAQAFYLDSVERRYSTPNRCC
jgi:hypothetical protein